MKSHRRGTRWSSIRLDQLARSNSHLYQIADALRRKEVELKGINQNTNTTDTTAGCLSK